MAQRDHPIVPVVLGILLLVGCQTRQLAMVQTGMNEVDVRQVFGEPDRIAEGYTANERWWYYFGYTSRPQKEWQFVPRANHPMGGEMELVTRSSPVEYPRFKITFIDGIVTRADEFDPPEF